MTSAPLSLLWRIARRDLSAGFRGLRLLFLCLFLGVGALAAIGSLTAAITGELTRKGRELLGGDLEVALTQRYAEGTEKAQMAQLEIWALLVLTALQGLVELREQQEMLALL